MLRAFVHEKGSTPVGLGVGGLGASRRRVPRAGVMPAGRWAPESPARSVAGLRGSRCLRQTDPGAAATGRWQHRPGSRPSPLWELGVPSPDMSPGEPLRTQTSALSPEVSGFHKLPIKMLMMLSPQPPGDTAGDSAMENLITPPDPRCLLTAMSAIITILIIDGLSDT